jgi:hypothetical protein
MIKKFTITVKNNFGEKNDYYTLFIVLLFFEFGISISNKADFSTHTYQQDFHVAPNPKKIIQLDASNLL